MSPKNAPSGASLALALVAILSAPLPGHASDKTVLRPQLDLEQGWDSNIFNRSSGEEGSLVTRLSPALWLENAGELGHARLGLTANGRSVWRESGLSGIDSNARGDFERKLTPRLSVFGDGALEYYSGYQQINGQDTTVLLSEQPAWKDDRLGAGFRYLLTPRLAVRLSGSAARVNYDRVAPFSVTASGRRVSNQSGNYRDRGSLDAAASLAYQLTALDELTLAVDTDDTSYQSLSYQTPSNRNVSTGSNDTSIWNTKLGWSRTWSPVWSTAATIGVRAIDTTQDGVSQSGAALGPECSIIAAGPPCPVELPPASFSSSGTGLIGSLAIQRTFARSLLRLSYDRDTRSTGGASRVNFDIDSFRLSLTHQLAERVKLSLVGDYTLYHSVSDKLPNYDPLLVGATTCPLGTVETQVPGPFGPFPVFQCIGGSSEEKREYTSLLARIDWKMRRQLNSYVVGRYYTSTTDQTFGSGSNIQTDAINKFTLGIGFRYAWDLGL